MPKVSVVLTSYNHADFIGESIESILNQSFKDFELYIVDDCSTDNSWDVIKKYAKKDKRIITIRHEKNIGGAIAPDLIKRLKGEYFCVAHCDDKWELTKLEKQVKYLDKHKNVGACFTWVKYIDEDGSTLENTNGEKYTNFNIKNKNRYEWLNYFFFKGNCLCHPSVMLRTKIQLDEYLFSSGMGAFPDLNRWIKLCLKHDIYVYPEELTCFRLRNNESNTSGYTPANIVRCQFDLIHLLESYKYLSSDDFLKVFDDAKEYVVDGEIDLRFALARICIDKVKTPPYILFGLSLIYDILQNPEDKKRLEKLYDYSSGMFCREVGEHDVFNVIDSKKILDTSLFLDTGNDFNENEKISKIIFMKDNYFNIVFDVEDKKVLRFRFDPDERFFRKFKNVKIYVNDKKMDFDISEMVEKDGWSYFFTTDPMFIVSYEGNIKNVRVEGFTEIISYEELESIKKCEDEKQAHLTMIDRVKYILRK